MVLKKSVHHLNGFLLVIPGTQSLLSGLYVAVHNEREAVRLLGRSKRALFTETFTGDRLAWRNRQEAWTENVFRDRYMRNEACSQSNA
jgi:hypothetical protein